MTASEIPSTIEGLRGPDVEVLREVYECQSHGNIKFTLQMVLDHIGDAEGIRLSHIKEFDRQLQEGERCSGCGRHHTQARINPATNLGDCCDVGD